jgi:hypothetical protein
MRRRLRLTPLLLALLAPACFRYQAVDLGAVSPQEEVRVLLTDEAAVRLALNYGAINKRLEGQLAPAASDSLMLAVWIGRNYVGTSFENARQRLSLGRGEIMEVRRRTFSPARTAIVTAGVIGVIGIIIDRIGFLENPNPLPGGGRGDVPDQDGITIPIGRIR